MARYVDDIANLTPSNGQPFVGRAAFAHKGGMHAHAMQLAPTSYEHIDPQLVGNTRRVLVSELSGRANIAALTEKHGITDPEVHRSPALRRARLLGARRTQPTRGAAPPSGASSSSQVTKAVLAEIVRRENLGYTYEAAEACGRPRNNRRPSRRELFC